MLNLYSFQTLYVCSTLRLSPWMKENSEKNALLEFLFQEKKKVNVNMVQPVKIYVYYRYILNLIADFIYYNIDKKENE